ncbi:nuclear transport factor 2 family protein [Algoriphagus sp.]|uniref:nuclear transport factor 2 family protein n=1 Tax=Algoriphagus sp. TaxID=1872435 RepID=UPI00391A3D66
MKIALTLFFAMTLTLAFSQSEKEVEDAVQKFRTALLAEDANALKSLTSANLSYGHSGGVIESQAEFVEVFTSKRSDYKTWEVSDQTISFHGKKLAIVRQNILAEILSLTNGTTNNLNMGLMMIWVKEKGAWKLLARQSFRYPQG